MIGSKTRSLKFYVIITIIVLAIVIALRYLIAGTTSLLEVSVFCAGFLWGMFLAANLYRSPTIWKNQNRLNEKK
jgi:uncharacterized membrane protein (DUF485 family)